MLRIDSSLAASFITRLAVKRVFDLVVVVIIAITASVLSVALTERRKRRESLALEPLRVIPSARPVAVSTEVGQSRTHMLVSVNNGTIGTISHVTVEVNLRNGTPVYDTYWGELPPLTTRSVVREPTEHEWARTPGSVFDVVVVVTFVDPNGMWLHDSDGRIRRLR